MNIKLYSIFNKAALVFTVMLLAGFSVQAQYCTPVFASSCATAPVKAIINGVSTTGGSTNFTNTGTGCANTTTSYSDYTGTAMKVTQNAFQSVNVKVDYDDDGSNSVALIKIWVDWNRNDTFDASELVPSASPTAHAVGTPLPFSRTIKIDVPGYAKNGLTRMRVMLGSQGAIWNAAYGPCGVPIASGGEAEDYNFEVINPCLPPAITVEDINFKSAKVRWPRILNGLMYEYVIVRASATFPDTNVFGYNYSVDSVHKIDTFACDTKYYVLVKSICDTVGLGNKPSNWFQSAWTVDSFTTHPCCYKPEVQVSNITHNSAVVSWSPINSALFYEYALSVTPTPPGVGTKTTNTTIKLHGLTSRTQQYFHIRTLCSPTPFSEWTYVTFKSLPPTSVGSTENDELMIGAYPNPVKDVLNVNLIGTPAPNATITIVDITGKVKYHSAIKYGKLMIDTKDFASGMYMIKYHDDRHNDVFRITK